MNDTFGRKSMARALGAALGAACLLATAPAGATVKCRQTIAAESAKVVQAATKVLQKCNEAVVAKGVAGACADPKVGEKLDKAESAAKANIAKQCCGKDKLCGTLDDATGAFAFGRCPDSEGPAAPASDCTGILVQTNGDIGTCLACLGREHASEAVAAYYGSLVPTDPKDKAEKALNKCQVAIGKESAKFLAAKSKALQKCRDSRFKGKHANPCPDPGDGKAAEAIEKAESKKVAAICKACGGKDKACDGIDDFAVADIGFPDFCPPLVDDGAIGAEIETLADLVECVDKVTADRVDCTDAAGATSLLNAPVSLPGKCTGLIETCAPDGGTATVQATFNAAPGIDLGGITVSLGYRNVTLPGSGDASARVTNKQPGTSIESNDTDDQLVVSITGLDPFTPGALFEVELDTCNGAPAAGDFGCVVRDASTPLGASILEGVTCSVAIL
jgi:hypothetical protein